MARIVKAMARGHLYPDAGGGHGTFEPGTGGWGGDLFICTSDLHASAAGCAAVARADPDTLVPDVFGNLGSTVDSIFRDRFE